MHANMPCAEHVHTAPLSLLRRQSLAGDRGLSQGAVMPLVRHWTGRNESTMPSLQWSVVVAHTLPARKVAARGV